jgi:hypothetical protein
MIHGGHPRVYRNPPGHRACLRVPSTRLRGASTRGCA